MKRKDDNVIKTFANLPMKQLCHVPIIAVYKNPKDYPDKYVARLWDVHNRPTEYVMVENNLEEIRCGIPETMTRLPPSSIDDPVLLETWL